MSDASAFTPARSRRPLVLALGAWLALAVAAGAAAQTARPVEDGDLSLQAYTLRHQGAEDAVELVSPFLSERGSIELQPIGNTVVIRDEASRIARIMPVLRSFDHPRRSIRVEVRIVRASVEEVAAGSGVVRGTPQLSQLLTDRLRDLLRYQHYDLLASADLTSLEGDPVLYEVGGDYLLGLRLGTVLATRRIKLHDFRLSRATADETWRPLIHTNLEITLGDPMVLGLAPAESSEHALMLVLTCRVEGDPQPVLRAE